MEDKIIFKNLEFTLSGEDKENSERKAYVRLTATEKFNPEAVVTLTVDDTVYEADVLIKFHISPEHLDKLNKSLADATSGEVQAVSDGEKYFTEEI